ncbi:MAG TPA: hypothetical protein VHC19_20695 [Pirellulales bacterium]|nr:hypothetical protein [Pirellulales bacterium]
MSNVQTHNEMHSDHRLWDSEATLWEDDIQIWEGELNAALAEMKQLEEVLAEHRKGLESHAEAIRAARADRATHEHALAKYEHGETGEDLVVLAQKHEAEAEHRAELRQTHERVKRHHHTVMAHWRLLFKALSKEM